MDKTLSTTHFIKKFKLNQENYEFNRENFLKELNIYFQQRIKAIELEAKGTKDGFTYAKFKHCISQTLAKFDSISNHKVGMPLTSSLWDAFFAIYITKARKELFPEIQAKIDEAKRNNPIPVTEKVDSNAIFHNKFKYGSSRTKSKEIAFNRFKQKFDSAILVSDDDNISVAISHKNLDKLFECGSVHWIDTSSKGSYFLELIMEEVG